MKTDLRKLKKALLGHFLYGAQNVANEASFNKPYDITKLSCSMSNYGILLGHIQGAQSIDGFKKAMRLSGLSQEEADNLIKKMGR